MSAPAPVRGLAVAANGAMPSGGLALHGINHLSPSSLNAYVAQPAAWVMERLLGRRAPVGCAAHRGTASEAGIVMGLLDPGAAIPDCIAHAQAEFDRLTPGSTDPNLARERDGIAGIVAAAIPELRAYGIPQTQVRIDRSIDGVPVPVIGYIDLHWPEHGLTLDIKSTFRVPGAITTAHARQVAIYVHGTNNQARIAYCSPKKIMVYQLTDTAQPIAEAVQIAQRMDRFLALSSDPAALASLLVPDTDHYFYANPIAAAHRREIYGV
jgi:hypothetical protein